MGRGAGLGADFFRLSFILGLGLVGGLLFGLLFGLVEARSVLIMSHTPKEATSHSLIAALFWLISGLLFWLFFGPDYALGIVLAGGLFFGLVLGSGLGLRKGGRFVLLQKVARRRLARVGKLPPRPANFLQWGIEQQIFRQVGGGVRFRHSLIQQHLANTSAEEVSTQAKA